MIDPNSSSARMHPRTVVSTFSGCGGSSLGYRMAGMKVLLAVELDEHAVQTYRTNFPNTPVFAGDIHNLTSAEVLEKTGLTVGELDVLDGSPPCQGFSVAGLRKFSDDRNSLFKEYVRLARDLQPRVLVMENVPGLVTGKMKLIFAEMLTELKAAGYDVEARVLNAMYYGVPQSRNRVIFIGVRKDLGIRPSHPIGCERIISFAEATRGLPIDSETRLKGLALELWSKTDPGRAFSDHHPKGHWFNAIKVHPSRPTGTVTKTCFMGQAGLYHHRYARPLTIAELKRVASFPDWFRFEGKFTEQWARIGNSVPPAFMEKIALHIEDAILSPADRMGNHADRVGQVPRRATSTVDPERGTDADPSLGSARTVRTQRGATGGHSGETEESVSSAVDSLNGPHRATKADPSLGSARAVRTRRGANGGPSGNNQGKRSAAPKAKRRPE